MQQTAEDIQAAIDSIFDAGEAAIEDAAELCKKLLIKDDQDLIERIWAKATKGYYDYVTDGMDEESAGRIFRHLERTCMARYRETLRYRGRAEADALGEAHLLDALPVGKFWRSVLGAN